MHQRAISRGLTALLLFSSLVAAPAAGARPRHRAAPSRHAVARRHVLISRAPTLVEPARPKKNPLPTKAAVIFNARTGQLLYQAGAHQHMPPASTTKIITALVILDYFRPSE